MAHFTTEAVSIGRLVHSIINHQKLWKITTFLVNTASMEHFTPLWALYTTLTPQKCIKIKQKCIFLWTVHFGVICMYWPLITPPERYYFLFLFFFHYVERAKYKHYEIAPFKPLSGPSKVVSFIKWRLRVEKNRTTVVYIMYMYCIFIIFNF